MKTISEEAMEGNLAGLQIPMEQIVVPLEPASLLA